MQLLEPAYLLHARPYRNTSVLADFFTLNHGRVNGVVRGVRGEKSKLRSVVQPFIPLMISWIGKSELVTIKQIEPTPSSWRLSGEMILYGFYINELLSRLLRVRDAHHDLYQAYETFLQHLTIHQCDEKALRIFEKRLLSELGYALQLVHDHDSGEFIESDKWYNFTPDHGPQLLVNQQQIPEHAFLGASLLALDKEDIASYEVLRDAKRLMRQALGRLLGDKPIKSRELFVR